MSFYVKRAVDKPDYRIVSSYVDGRCIKYSRARVDRTVEREGRDLSIKLMVGVTVSLEIPRFIENFPAKVVTKHGQSPERCSHLPCSYPPNLITMGFFNLVGASEK